MANQSNTNNTGVLFAKKLEFSELLKKVEEMLIDRRQKHGDSEALQTIESLCNTGIELMDIYQALIDSPSHVHRPTYRTGAINYSQNPTYNQEENFTQHITNTSGANVLQERMYPVGEDLIFSTSGRFAFKPLSGLLMLAAGHIVLSENESKTLLQWMKYDYQLS